jgi:hypothetical protein
MSGKFYQFLDPLQAEPLLRTCTCRPRRFLYWVDKWPGKSEPAQPHFAKGQFKRAFEEARNARYTREANGTMKRR